MFPSYFRSPLDVAGYFGSYDQQTGATWTVQTVWVWNNAASQWLFWSPQLSTDENKQYAAEKGFEVALQIEPGQGFWVNSWFNTSLPRIVGEQFVRTPAKYAALPPGWNIIGGDGSPSQFNLSVSPMLVGSCQIPTANFTTLWAWDTSSAMWIFYAPQLEAMGDAAVEDYANAKGYKNGMWFWFEHVGFWVNKPQD